MAEKIDNRPGKFILAYKGYTGFTGIHIDELDLNKTFDCGQCFRWKKMTHNTWFGVIGEKAIMMKQEFRGKEDKYPILITTASRKEAEDILIRYLDLPTNYIDKIDTENLDSYTLRCLENGKGIRILRQDLWETIITFIISQRNSIKRIQNTVEKICELYGKEVKLSVNGEELVRYTFPKPEELKGKKLPKELGLGYRAEYIEELVERVNKQEFNIEELKHMDTEHCLERLKQIRGVGDKVANCIALFGLGKLECFPIDTWIQKGLNRQDESGNEIAFDKFRGMEGYIQQCIFYTERYMR